MRPEEPKPIRRVSRGDGFNPQLYNFRLQHKDQGPRVRSPPFHVQLDHTIAVLWCLYNNSSITPDVGHLQWAKHFLQRIRNHHGDMPKDVEIVVKAIEESMLAMYAALSRKPSYKPATCCSDEPQDCQAKQSVTFTEMVQQRPTEVVEELFCVDKMELPETCSSHLACDCQTSKEEMSKYLKQQRAERVRIIHAELKRLQEIDQFMGNVDGSTTDILGAKSLEEIENGMDSRRSTNKPASPRASQASPRASQASPRASQSERRSVRMSQSGNEEVPEGRLVDIE